MEGSHAACMYGAIAITKIMGKLERGGNQSAVDAGGEIEGGQWERMARCNDCNFSRYHPDA